VNSWRPKPALAAARLPRDDEAADALGAARLRAAGAGAAAAIRRRAMSTCMFRAIVFCGSSCSAASIATVASSS
jgi:hypothetical protein